MAGLRLALWRCEDGGMLAAHMDGYAPEDGEDAGLAGSTLGSSSSSYASPQKRRSQVKAATRKNIETHEAAKAPSAPRTPRPSVPTCQSRPLPPFFAHAGALASARAAAC